MTYLYWSQFPKQEIGGEDSPIWIMVTKGHGVLSRFDCDVEIDFSLCDSGRNAKKSYECLGSHRHEIVIQS